MIVIKWVSESEQDEHHHQAWVFHHLAHPAHLLKAALSTLGDCWGLVDIPYVYLPTYLMNLVVQYIHKLHYAQRPQIFQTHMTIELFGSVIWLLLSQC